MHIDVQNGLVEHGRCSSEPPPAATPVVIHFVHGDIKHIDEGPTYIYAMPEADRFPGVP